MHQFVRMLNHDILAYNEFVNDWNCPWNSRMPLEFWKVREFLADISNP